MVLINRRGAKEEQRRDAEDDSETRKVDSQGRNGRFLRLVIITNAACAFSRSQT